MIIWFGVLESLGCLGWIIERGVDCALLTHRLWLLRVQIIFASGEQVCMYNPPDYRYHNRTVIDSVSIGLTRDGLFVWTWCQHVWSAFGSSNSNFEHRGRRAIWGKDSRPASECRSLALKNCRRIATRLKHAICGDSTSSTPALMYLAAWPMTWGFAALHSS